MFLSRLGRLRAAVVVLVIVGAVAFPLGVLALTFGDVPMSSPFYADIGAISDAGITNGCGAGNYCPKANVTREQMAAFMKRGFTSSNLGFGGAAFDELEAYYLTGATLQTPGVPGGTGYMTVQADLTAFNNDAGMCPCDVVVWFDVLDDGWTLVDQSVGAAYQHVGDVSATTGTMIESFSFSWVFQVPTGVERSFAVSAAVLGSTGALTATSGINAAMVATYSPFGSVPADPTSAAEGVPFDLGVDVDRSPKSLSQ